MHLAAKQISVIIPLTANKLAASLPLRGLWIEICAKILFKKEHSLYGRALFLLPGVYKKLINCHDLLLDKLQSRGVSALSETYCKMYLARSYHLLTDRDPFGTAGLPRHSRGHSCRQILWDHSPCYTAWLDKHAPSPLYCLF